MSLVVSENNKRLFLVYGIFSIVLFGIDIKKSMYRRIPTRRTPCSDRCPIEEVSRCDFVAAEMKNDVSFFYNIEITNEGFGIFKGLHKSFKLGYRWIRIMKKLYSSERNSPITMGRAARRYPWLPEGWRLDLYFLFTYRTDSNNGACKQDSKNIIKCGLSRNIQ